MLLSCLVVFVFIFSRVFLSIFIDVWPSCHPNFLLCYFYGFHLLIGL